MLFKLILILFIFVNYSLADDFNVTLVNFVNIQRDTINDLNSTNATVQHLVNTINSNGSWPDISYHLQNGSVGSTIVWQPLRHVENFHMMAIVYSLSNNVNSTSGNDTTSNQLLNSTLLAFDFWISSNLNAPDDITRMKSLVSLTTGSLLIYTHLNQSRLDALRNLLNQVNISSSTNTSISDQLVMNQFTLVKGLYIQDISLVSTYFNNTSNLIRISNSTDDGIKADGTFYSNGQIIHNGNIGAIFIKDTLFAMIISNGTSFNFTQEKMDIWANFVLNGTSIMAISGSSSTQSYWSPQVTQYLMAKENGTRFDIPTNLLLRSPVRNQEFQALVQYLSGNETDNSDDQREVNKQYWYGDFMLHSRDDYLVSLKMYSTRTFNTDCYKGDGITTGKISDGSFFLQMTGREYFNIYPLYNWDLVPGITTDYANSSRNNNLTCEDVKVRGMTEFVGSVSDGTYGAAAMDLSTSHSFVTAKKSWFFFDDEIVLLGSNINGDSSNSSQVVTSIDQRFTNGPIYTSESSNVPLNGNQTTFNNTIWFHHDSVGVYFIQAPTSQNQTSDVVLHISSESVTGNWEDIGTSSSGNVSGQVFTAYQIHQQQQSHYSYIVYPDIDIDEFNDTINKNMSITVLSNSDQIQAVSHSELNIIQAIFWPGSSNTSLNTSYGFQLSASSACIVQLKMNISSSGNGNSSNIIRSGTNIFISVSDPTQRLLTVQLSFTNVQLSGPNATFDSVTNRSTIVFTLPTSQLAGSTITQIYQVGNETTNPNTTTTSVSTTGSGVSTTTSLSTTGTSTTSVPITGTPTTSIPTTGTPTTSVPTTGTSTTSVATTGLGEGTTTDTTTKSITTTGEVTTTVDVTTTSSTNKLTIPSLLLFSLILLFFIH